MQLRLTKARKYRFLTIVALTLICLTACEKNNTFVINEEKAVGVVIVNGTSELANGKIYAEKTDNMYSFPMDAACIYYFDTDEETSYAGFQNLTALSFGANIDKNTVGAVGQIAYQPSNESDNTITAYYLYYDGVGLYFTAEQAFQSAEVTEDLVLQGTDYECSVTVIFQDPAESFTVIGRDTSNTVLFEQQYQITDVVDYQKIQLPQNTVTAEWTSFTADGANLYHESLTPDTTSFVVCYSDGGQILASKLLQLVWPE